jgi:hypothetical protein
MSGSSNGSGRKLIKPVAQYVFEVPRVELPCTVLRVFSIAFFRAASEPSSPRRAVSETEPLDVDWAGFLSCDTDGLCVGGTCCCSFIDASSM